MATVMEQEKGRIFDIFTSIIGIKIILPSTRGSQPVLRGALRAPRPRQENKIDKNWMKLKNKKQKVESK